MSARFDARDINYGPLLLVTHPPKRRLSLTMEAATNTSQVSADAAQQRVLTNAFSVLRFACRAPKRGPEHR